jgi:hypothetical protein
MEPDCWGVTGPHPGARSCTLRAYGTKDDTGHGGLYQARWWGRCRTTTLHRVSEYLHVPGVHIKSYRVLQEDKVLGERAHQRKKRSELTA